MRINSNNPVSPNVARINRDSATISSALRGLSHSQSKSPASADELRLSTRLATLRKPDIQLDAQKAERTGRLLSALKSRLTDVRADVVAIGSGGLDAAESAEARQRVDDNVLQIQQLVAFFDGEVPATSNEVRSSSPNRAQINEFLTDAFTGVGSRIVSGELVSAGEQAEIQIAGDAGRIARSTTTVRISGNRGAIDVAIQQGESLLDVRERINQLTSSTGVIASIEGNNLQLRSVEEGNDAFVSIGGTAQATTFRGVNNTQVVDFRVNSMNGDSTETITGSVSTSATQAAVTLLGDPGGIVKSTATFTVAGNDGNVQIDIVEGESLAAVRDRVNQETGVTGVSAEISGNDLLFRSTAYGGAATVSVQAGSVNPDVIISGVNGSQVAEFEVVSVAPGVNQQFTGNVTATATQAELDYFGIPDGPLSVAKANATFELTGHLGTSTISVTFLEPLTAVRDRINAETANTGITATVSGGELSIVSTDVGSAAFVEINVTSGSFETSGGNGDGTADGNDATATINGQSLTADRNRFTVTEATGTFEIEFQPGFTGVFDTITVDAVSGDFEVTGGNGDGTGNGTDATATINGQNLTGNVNRFSLSTGNGVFTIEFAQGFTGVFDPIDVESVGGGLRLIGDDGDGTVNGSDAVAVFNGETVIGNGRRFTFGEKGEQLTLEFAQGFSGTFDPINLATVPEFNSRPISVAFAVNAVRGSRSEARLPEISYESLGGRSGSIGELLTGGRLSDSGDDAVRTVENALRFVSDLERATYTLGRLANQQSESVLLDSLRSVSLSGSALRGVAHSPIRVLELLARSS